VRAVREMARLRFPDVGVRNILISEIVSEAYYYSPGDLLTHLKYLDDADVQYVGRSCWSDCWNPTLAGSVFFDEAGNAVRTAIWWANYWYASLIGERYSGVSTDKEVAAYGVRRGSDLELLVSFAKGYGHTDSRNLLLKLNGMVCSARPRFEIVRMGEMRSDREVIPRDFYRYKIDAGIEKMLIRLEGLSPGELLKIKLSCEDAS
jgi:hypothetical protein